MRQLLLLILLLAGFALSSWAQTMNTSVNTRARFKSMFIYKFAQSTEWPEAYKAGDFIIGVVNDDPLAAELETMAKTKSINSQTVVVKRFKSAAEVTKCHVLYIGGTSSSDIEPYATKARQFNCLIITEGSGLVDKFSAINFIVVGSQIKYEMNRKLFRDQGLVVSNSLENLASRVIN